MAVLNPDALHRVVELAPQTPVRIVSNIGPVFHDRRAPNRDHGDLVVFAGRVGRRKGVDTLVAAWSHIEEAFPSATLAIAGPLEEDLDNETLAELTDHYHGELAPEEISALLNRASIAALPSRGEGQPMFLIEALAHGVPIVVTPVGGMPQLADGTGSVVPVGDPHELARAILEIMRDRERRAALGAGALRKYQSEFSVTSHSSALLELYSL